jgi:hypothetical protein
MTPAAFVEMVAALSTWREVDDPDSNDYVDTLNSLIEKARELTAPKTGPRHVQMSGICMPGCPACTPQETGESQ